MLPEQDRQLLTAYVDGELSSRQRRHVVRLLKRSRDARHLLRALQQDAATLSEIKVPTLDFDLSVPVVQTIHERRLTPHRRKPKPVTPAFPAWIAVAVAASVLCMIGLGSYIGFAAFLAKPASAPSGDPMARSETPEKKPDPPAPVAVKDDKKPEKKEEKPDVALTNPKPPSLREFVGPPAPIPNEEKNPTVVVKRPSELHGPPLPDPKSIKEGPTDPPLTDKAMERFELELVIGARQPVFLELHKLDQDEPRKKLNSELALDTGFRLELPCDNGTKAFERLQAVCKDQKITILIDTNAQKRLKAPQFKTNYILYIENVTPEELSRLVQQIGAEDKKAASKKSADAHFDRLVVTRLTKRDYKELSDLLGIDPPKVEPPKVPGPLGVDLRKPLEEQTAEQIAKALDGDKSKSKSAEVHQALVLSYNPVLPLKNSPEVKKFLDARKAAKPDTVRAIIVLRGT